jgi:hypothetical protein
MPEWSTAGTFQENFIGIITSDEIWVQDTLVYIHLNDDAPSNSTFGFVKLRCAIND